MYGQSLQTVLSKTKGKWNARGHAAHLLGNLEPRVTKKSVDSYASRS